MSTPLEDAASFARDMRAVNVLAAAIERAAVAIMAEAATTTYHLERVGMARDAIQDPTQFVQRFAWAVSTNEQVVTKWASGDESGAIADFQFVINSLWNAVAGVAAA